MARSLRHRTEDPALSESQLILAALAELQHDPEVAEKTAREMARRYGLR
jgi:hypothetical protein